MQIMGEIRMSNNIEIISRLSLDSTFTYCYTDRDGNDIYRHGLSWYKVIRTNDYRR
jgi:hypothetical protein